MSGISLRKKPTKRRKAKSHKTSYLVIIAGLLLFAIPLSVKVIYGYELQLLKNKSTVNSIQFENPLLVDPHLLKATDAVGDYPSRIVIKPVKVNLQIKASRVVSGFWEIHNDTANYGIGSSLPQNDSGNTVIFAHAKKGLFLPLRKVKKHDVISIETANGKSYNYQVVEKKEVSPQDTEIIQNTLDKTLTLFTCSGFADRKRLIVIAKEKG